MTFTRKTPPISIPPTRVSKRLRRGTHPHPSQDESSNISCSSSPPIGAPGLELDPNIPEIIRSQPYSGPKSSRTQLALGLPPLYKLGDIYISITKRAIELQLDDFLSHISSRQLRVVTVCSGTESPLLALEMVQKNLKTHFNRDFNVHHLFSAEIVPFKQAYIERNFHPRFIFRDVSELRDRVAQTAYGSLEKIPKNPDILIAGFSCVDFSGLNNKRKTLDEKGESGGTFWGIVRYAKTYRPPIVILENVKTAPWDKIEQHWDEIDYFAVHVDIDTKEYYLPQTRERGYMFCVDRKLMKKNGLRDEDMLRWTDVFASFKRPASSPAGMFLVDADDRRLEQIEKDMAVRIVSSSSRATVNWARYQVRHQSYRLNQGLGYKRPVSKSQDDGTCQMPDFAWQTWVKSLPERVWDTIDVNFLRKLAEGYDMNYKERCIELSQGVEREVDSRAYGIVGCITPCGIPYITTRGGPLCGLESLALQGLPLDRLLLTQESQRELQDLAGNAMSSTVVGAAVLSALIVGHRVLKKGNHRPIGSFRAPKHRDIAPSDKYKLVPKTMLLEQVIDGNTAELKKQAVMSARYCACERQSSIKTPILRCSLCEHTACLECGGNPRHAYERWNGLTRSLPLSFVTKLRTILPPRLVVSGISQENYNELKHNPGVNCTSHVWRLFLEAVGRAIGDELRLVDIKRSEVWTASYEGKFSILNLILGVGSIHWEFFANPSDTEPALCLNREILSKPIARMVPTRGSILEGEWEVCAPLSSRCMLRFMGIGNQTQTYEATCGLEIQEFSDAEVWTQINIQGPDEDMRDLEIDIRGTYNLLRDCGTANACLHKRPAIDGKPDVYLFLDPTKLGEPKNDSFVFSLEHNRNPGYAARATIAEVSHKWRSLNVTSSPEPTAVYYRKWTRVPTARLSSYAADKPIICYNLDPEVTFSISNYGCHNTNITLLSLLVPEEAFGSVWSGNEWNVANPTDSANLVREFSWLLQKATGLLAFHEWKEVASDQGSVVESTACTVCVPPKPRILWGCNRRGWIRAYEDPHDAALYERQVKSKPPPFLIFRRINGEGYGDFRITLNIQTLLHQAYDRLITSERPGLVSFHWRLVPNSYDARNLAFPKFELMSNRNDPPGPQPPRFLLDLRPEQLRSLSWMIQQEANDIEPFIEEETEEAILPSLMWRAEGRAIVQKAIRGGVLADDVGYGKTAIVLGLIDMQHHISSIPEPDPVAGTIPSKATLIVVPHIMLQQWKSEITKFLGEKYKVLVFQTTVALTKHTIKDIRTCDIILVSWSVFNTASYYEKMKKFTGTPRVPAQAGRHFDDWFLAAQASLREHVQILIDQGPHAFVDSVRIKRQKVKDSRKHYTYVPSKRLRGSQYKKANRNTESAAQSGVHYAEISSADEASDYGEESPEILRKRVDHFLKLVSPLSSDSRLEGTSESVGEDSEYNDSSSETLSMSSNSTARKRKRRATTTDNKCTGQWDDWIEFNIDKNHKTQDWETLRTPLLHAFAFNRLVIDEFTYAKPDRLGPLLALRARSKWVLSGTPPLNDFADVKTIAPFLGVHLGIDDEDLASQNKRLKMLSKQRSEAETFQSYRAPRSEAWHRNRNMIAQRFLDRFARRNVAEIDEIPFTEHIVLVPQTPAEKAIYLELYKQLMTYNRQLRRSGRSRFSGDQTQRLDEIISSSSTAEEALLKRCTSLALQDRWDNGKPEGVTCKSLISVRESQLANLRDELGKKLKLAAWVYCTCDVKHEGFHKFIESIIRHDYGDMTVTDKVYPLLKRAILTSTSEDWKIFFAQPLESTTAPLSNDESSTESSQAENEEAAPGKEKLKSANKKPSNEIKSCNPTHLPNKPTRVREFEPILREVTTTIRNLIVEWVLRERALRFLKNVRHVQATNVSPSSKSILECYCCHLQPDHFTELSILGSCGHTLCAVCAADTAQREECPVEGCRGSGKRFNIINASTLGSDEEDLSSEYGGSKMGKLVEIIQGVPAVERILLFIQLPELIEVASKALDLARIRHTTISATDRKSAQKVEQFQKTGFGEEKVLILNLGSEMAAGLNLQCANHVIFLSPLLTQTQYDYDSTMTQAIGRSRRYGQSRHVHVYHLLSKMTIDVNIFQERRGEKVLMEREGKAVLVSHDEAMESEAMTCQGPSLVVDNAF